MKRTLPLLITAAGGFVLIIAFFIPATEGWGEVAAIWFDILAAIAFILGGGNLLKIHLKKISDRARGWGYSAVTLIAFLTMLYFGLLKTGAKPAANQEYYGEVFARLALDDFPQSQITRVRGEIPDKGSGEKLPPSARRQLSAEDGRLVFCGWMTGSQKTDLAEYEDTLAWRCTVERLHKEAQPPAELKGKVAYYIDHQALAFKGRMTAEQKTALLQLAGPDNAAWKQAVESLHKRSNEEHSIELDSLPEKVNIPVELKDVVRFDAPAGRLVITGPMSAKQRDKLAKDPFSLVRPFSGDRRTRFLKDLESQGQPLTAEQKATFHKVLDGVWTADQLIKVLDAAGDVPETDKDACALLEEQQSGVTILEPTKREGFQTRLSEQHQDAIRLFAAAPAMTVEQLIEDLNAIDQQRLAPATAAAGPGGFALRGQQLESSLFVSRQETALKNFVSRFPTQGEQNARLAAALLRDGPLTQDQREFLTAAYHREQEWRQTVGELFVAAHTTKYPWSGEYRETGTPFWWMYEYVFKPLTATMFAMLAFYVASAAFRAFRAKNLEAMLLLGTAFIILLGRTFAGVLLTDWIPENSGVGGLRIENLTMYIMTVFNTAGNRAIMIGIALGIASTSLKVLLGVDRSYLGTQEE